MHAREQEGAREGQTGDARFVLARFGPSAAPVVAFEAIRGGVSGRIAGTYRSPIDSPRPQAEPYDVPQQESELADGVHLKQSGLRHLQADVREEREPERQRHDPSECPAQRAAGAKDHLRIQQDLRVLARGVEVVHGDAGPEAADQRDHGRARCRRGSRRDRKCRCSNLQVGEFFETWSSHPPKSCSRKRSALPV